MSIELVRKIAECQGRIHSASDAAFQAFGRNDLTIAQLTQQNPKHDVIVKLQALNAELKTLTAQMPKKFHHIRGY